MQTLKKRYTVLLLSAPIGSGHRLAAEALEQALAVYPELEVVHGNIFNFFPQWLGSAFLRTYLWILRCCPFLYKLAYRWGDRQNGSLWLRSLLNRLLAYLGRSYLDRVQPDAVVATHATPAGIIGYYKERCPQLWLGAVVTDFTIHRWWICEGVDTYFIADELLRAKLKTQAEVVASGIPVRRQFQQQDKAACRARFDWQAGERVCLLMGGGEGLLPMAKIIAAVQAAKLPGLRLIAVTGHNEQLAQELRERFGASLEVYGFRKDVPQLLAGADLIITKAGGLTSAEVLASNLELLLYKPLPGQEEGNAAFLHRHCGALVAHNVEQLVQYLRQQPAAQQRLQVRRQHAHPEAAQEIAAYIYARLQGHQE